MADGTPDATQPGNVQTLQMKQGPGTTPSGWDYVDAAFDALWPSLSIVALAAVAVTAQGGSLAFTNPELWIPGAIVALAQVGAYLRGIYTGRRASVQV